MHEIPRVCVCRVCIGSCLGFGINFNPLFFVCVSVKVVCFANTTKELLSSVSTCW